MSRKNRTAGQVERSVWQARSSHFGPIALLISLLILVAGSAGCAGDSNQKGSDGDPGGTPNPLAAGEAVWKKRCSVCHNNGMFGAKKRPEMMASAMARMAAYEQHLEALQDSAPSLYAKSETAFQEILNAGPEQRFEVWLKHYVANPRFDREKSKMNPVQLSPSEFADLLLLLKSVSGS